MAAGKKNTEEKNTGTPGIERSLRDAAEKKLANSPKIPPYFAGTSPEQIIHELRVHQFELEMQVEELRKFHLALEESRDKFLDLYEFAPIGYFTFNDKARITEVNLTGVTLLGVERSKLVKHGLGRFIAPESHDAWDQYFVNIRQHGGKHTCNLTLIRGDGSLFPVWLEGVRYTNNEGMITVRIAVNDITKRKQVEEALQKSEAQLRTILESTADGILAVDNEGIVLKVSRRFAEIWKMPQSIMDCGDDRTLLDFVLGQLNDPDAFLKKVQSLYGSDAEGKDILTFKDGRVFERYTSPMIMDGARIGRVWSFRDITERKRAEDTLQQANTKLNLLSSITRHDIKNKVIVIQCALQFARQKKGINKIQPFLDEIQDSVNVIGRQIEFSKDYQDLGVKSPEWLNLSYMITLAGIPAIQIIDKTGTLQIFADPLFEKVMDNLIDNTIRHGETATEVYISVITELDRIRIIWEDNGVGVLAEEKEMIFDRSFGKNTGLGLFLIREILAITGMTIQETGEPGKGARFEITVPNGRYRNYQNNQD